LAGLAETERAALLSDLALTSLQGVLTAVPDPRSRPGRRYSLSYLLTCLIAALVCNYNSLEATGQWCRDHQPLLERIFGPRSHLTPTGALYRWLLPQLDVAPIEVLLGLWVQATLQAPAAEPLLADGKTVRGAATAEAPGPHLLSVSTAYSQETLLQVRVETKTNEIPVLQAMLPMLPVAGRVVLADALHTQVETAGVITALQGDYVFIVKENHPTLHADLALYFADPAASFVTAQTQDYAPGRREQRSLKLTTELTPLWGQRWPALAQAGQLTRMVRTGAKTRTETVYVITSLPPHKAPPAQILALIRAYWGIENCRHYVRDVTFGEDRSRLRSGGAPQIMAALRNLAIALLRRAGTTAIASARRFFASHPADALALLIASPLPPG
jgi:predicted transposase YbfD/YdcC